MAVQPAVLARPRAESAAFVPMGILGVDAESADYVEEEWFASGEVDGHRYTTAVFVRRPRDRARFSGTIVVEPLHVFGAAPVYMFTSRYLMRSGHGWAAIYSQKSAVEMHVKPSDPQRYAPLDVWSDTPFAAPADLGPNASRDPADVPGYMSQMLRANGLSTPILAQVGAALAGGAGPFSGHDVHDVILAGHSQTGWVVTEYIRNGHEAHRLDDGSPVFHGYFPAGHPSKAFGARDVPIVQVLSDGDISDPRGVLQSRRQGRDYRRPDSDEPGDRFRLYELAGVAHMGTRHPPYSDRATWQVDGTGTAGSIPEGASMNSLPHFELISACMHLLVRWVADGVTPPRADRIEVGVDGFFVKDELGNTRGGVRCPQLDVPRLTYSSNPGLKEDGSPAYGVVGIEEPLPKATLEHLYRDHADYVERFHRRVGELVAQGWLLPDDADEMLDEADEAVVP